MKRVLCAVLALAVLMLAAGCSAGAETDDNSAAEVSGEKETALLIGEWDGNVYTNECFDITAAVPESWTVTGTEELVERLNLPVSLLEDRDALNAELAGVSTIYGMTANGGSGSGIQISFENLAVTGNTDMMPGGYLELVGDLMTDMYIQMGYTCTVGDIRTRVIGHSEYECVELSMESASAGFRQVYACRSAEDYLCVITMTANDDSGVYEMMGFFE